MLHMYNDIKDVLDVKLRHLKFDSKLLKQLKNFRLNWNQKDIDYIEFLGGNLLGNKPIRFSTRDEDMLFIDILNLDIPTIKKELYKVDEINPKWRTASNPIYLTMIYIMHRFTISTDIGKHRETAIKECYYILAYKILGSLMAYYFKHTVSDGVAKATYEKLSNRYLIKKHDNWQQLLEYRALDLLPPKGLHAKRLVRFTTDDSRRIIIDLQGRIRNLVKHIYSVMIDVKDNNEKIINTSTLTVSPDGIQSNKDIIERPDKYIQYLKGVVDLPLDYVNDDLIHIIGIILPNLDVDIFKVNLTYNSQRQLLTKDKLDIVATVMNLSLNYLNTKGINGGYTNRVMEIMVLLKNYYTSSSNKNKDVKAVKKALHKIISKGITRKTSWLVTTTVTANILYVFLRAITK